MQAFGVLFWLSIGVFVLWLMFKRPAGTHIPKVVDKGAYEVFATGVGPGFGYLYFFDGTGYAINMEDGLICTMFKGAMKKYKISDIRKIERVMVTPEKTVLYGNHSMGTVAGVGKQNARREREAYDESGLFIHVADIDTPVINIKFVDGEQLERSYEIMLQAMEGRLPHQDQDAISSLQNEKARENEENELRAQRKEKGLCILCGGALATPFDQAVGYHKSCPVK